MTERVRVTAHDPATGDHSTEELDPFGYVLVVGQHMTVSSLAKYANGTIQLTIKRIDS